MRTHQVVGMSTFQVDITDAALNGTLARGGMTEDNTHRRQQHMIVEVEE